MKRRGEPTNAGDATGISGILSSGTTDREHRTEEVPFEKPVAPIELTALDDANGLIEGPVHPAAPTGPANH